MIEGQSFTGAIYTEFDNLVGRERLLDSVEEISKEFVLHYTDMIIIFKLNFNMYRGASAFLLIQNHIITIFYNFKSLVIKV